MANPSPNIFYTPISLSSFVPNWEIFQIQAITPTSSPSLLWILPHGRPRRRRHPTPALSSPEPLASRTPSNRHARRSTLCLVSQLRPAADPIIESISSAVWAPPLLPPLDPFGFAGVQSSRPATPQRHGLIRRSSFPLFPDPVLRIHHRRASANPMASVPAPSSSGTRAPTSLTSDCRLRHVVHCTQPPLFPLLFLCFQQKTEQLPSAGGHSLSSSSDLLPASHHRRFRAAATPASSTRP